jgi:hypothetical protein
MVARLPMELESAMVLSILTLRLRLSVEPPCRLRMNPRRRRFRQKRMCQAGIRNVVAKEECGRIGDCAVFVEAHLNATSKSSCGSSVVGVSADTDDPLAVVRVP